MTKWLNDFFAWINRRNTFLIIFILCMANFFGLTLEGGEEQYFAFAKQFMDPVWMPNSFTLNHPAGGNLVFQLIVGFLLKYISFEQMAILGRTINFLLYAIPLSLIFKKLKISNIEMMFLLQVVFFGHQSLYAGEWIFKNFEEKTLAYIFVFWSIYYLINGKALISAAFAAISTYFHFLVGGWMFCFVWVYFIAGQKKFLPVLLSGAVYFLLTAPFILYLYRTYMVDNPAIVNGINTNVVYAFWRLKHHIGLFSDFHYFITHALGGVVLTLVLFLLCVFSFRKIRQPLIRQLNILNIVIFSQQFIFIIIALFDREGTLIKTYPFRTNSLSVLLFLTELVLIFKFYLSERLYRKVVSKYLANTAYPLRKMIFSNVLHVVLLGIFIPVFIMETTDMYKNLKSYHGDLDEAMVGLIDYVKEFTPGSSVFLFMDNDRPYSFIRKAERERFVVVKFAPTKSTAIYEWYKRALLKERLRKDIGLIDSLKTAYQIDYLVTDSLVNYPAIELEKQFGSHNLYKVR